MEILICGTGITLNSLAEIVKKIELDGDTVILVDDRIECPSSHIERFEKLKEMVLSVPANVPDFFEERQIPTRYVPSQPWKRKKKGWNKY